MTNKVIYKLLKNKNKNTLWNLQCYFVFLKQYSKASQPQAVSRTCSNKLKTEYT